jgi:hypothetical protein
VQSRRLATLSVSILAALSFSAAACNVTGSGGATASPTPSATPAVDAKEALSKAATELGRTSYRVNLTVGPASGTGALDPAAQQGQTSMSVFAGSTTLKVDTVLVGADMWVKLGGVPGVPDKWLHLDTSRLPESSGLGIRPGQLDPAGADKLIDAIATVEPVGPDQYRGTIDLTRASDSPAVDKATLDALGDRAKAVPFEATLDAQGRLTNLKLDLGQIEGVPAKVDVRYSDFGTAVSVTRPPAADVVEAPEAVYQLLGG